MGLLIPNPLIQIRGKIKDLYISQYGDKFFIKGCPRRQPRPATDAQKPVREDLAAGNRYWKTVQAQPGLKTVYVLAAARLRGKRAVDLAKSDRAHPPTVTDIDLSAHIGQPSDVIRIGAKDDFEVASVRVRILDLEGALIEEGDATMDIEKGTWIYASKTAVPAGKAVVIEVTAADHPGNKDVKKVDHVCGPRV